MALAAGATVLAAITIWLGVVSRSEQEALVRRHEYASQSPQLARVVQLVAQTLAESAQRSDDEPLRGLLTRTGFTIRLTPAPVLMPAPVVTRTPALTSPSEPALEAAPIAVPTASLPVVNTSLSPDPPAAALAPVPVTPPRPGSVRTPPSRVP